VTSIVWFRKDLRTHDHEALFRASQHGAVIPVFIWSPDEDRAGEASAWWLHHSLHSLHKSLQRLGFKLILRKGNYLSELQALVRETGASAVYFNKSYDPALRQQDHIINNTLSKQAVKVACFNGTLLLKPEQVLNRQDSPYRVFTPFYKQVINQPISQPFPVPKLNKQVDQMIDSLSINDLSLLPKKTWYTKFHTYWSPGEETAFECVQSFIDLKLGLYERERDFPAQETVMKLSPHLAWGEIGVRWLWYKLSEAALAGPLSNSRLSLDNHSNNQSHLSLQIESVLRQLVWREFAYHQLTHFPNMIDTPLKSSFLSFPWQDDTTLLEKWQRGLTGYPLVDAGMRQLWETGWMHNRVRMIVASFLVKHLLIPWTQGAAWFWETLVDADLAVNAMNWQWVAGCGIDAAPYFRIFNPITQGVKFDEEGNYIKKWIPSLAMLPTPYIHRPWEAPKELLIRANIQLGKDYPWPIIDHAYARERALRAYDHVKTKQP
jgi:deoxyribodipyrimidine photo-lyase